MFEDHPAIRIPTTTNEVMAMIAMELGARGTIKVTTAGTRVQASHKGNVKTVVFKARSDNTGDVYLGGDDVSSTAGMTLSPGEAIQFQLTTPASTSQFWADAVSNNDQVDYIGSAQWSNFRRSTVPTCDL